jgi:acyl-CoA thioesterase-1
MSGGIVFTGDSITDCDRRVDKRGLGSGYVDIVARVLRERGDDSTVVNTGVSGDRVEDLRQRWQADALDHAPTVLSIYIGVNDTLSTFFRGRPTPPADFERGYAELLERATAAGVPKLMVIDPFYIDTDDDSTQWCQGNAFFRADLDTKRPIVRDLAQRYGAAFLPLQEAMNEAVSERGRAVLASDGVHPSPLGHQLIAGLWLAAYDAFA